MSWKGWAFLVSEGDVCLQRQFLVEQGNNPPVYMLKTQGPCMHVCFLSKYNKLTGIIVLQKVRNKRTPHLIICPCLDPIDLTIGVCARRERALQFLPHLPDIYRHKQKGRWAAWPIGLLIRWLFSLLWDRSGRHRIPPLLRLQSLRVCNRLHVHSTRTPSSLLTLLFPRRQPPGRSIDSSCHARGHAPITRRECCRARRPMHTLDRSHAPAWYLSGVIDRACSLRRAFWSVDRRALRARHVGTRDDDARRAGTTTPTGRRQQAAMYAAAARARIASYRTCRTPGGARGGREIIEWSELSETDLTHARSLAFAAPAMPAACRAQPWFHDN